MAAQKLTDRAETTDPLVDTDLFHGVDVSISPPGSSFKYTMLKLWNYIKSKIGGSAGQVLYKDGAGEITSDSEFFRNDTITQIQMSSGTSFANLFLGNDSAQILGSTATIISTVKANPDGSSIEGSNIPGSEKSKVNATPGGVVVSGTDASVNYGYTLPQGTPANGQAILGTAVTGVTVWGTPGGAGITGPPTQVVYFDAGGNPISDVNFLRDNFNGAKRLQVNSGVGLTGVSSVLLQNDEYIIASVFGANQEAFLNINNVESRFLATNASTGQSSELSLTAGQVSMIHAQSGAGIGFQATALGMSWFFTVAAVEYIYYLPLTAPVVGTALSDVAGNGALTWEVSFKSVTGNNVDNTIPTAPVIKGAIATPKTDTEYWADGSVVLGLGNLRISATLLELKDNGDGIQIGTAGNQLIGLYGATPVAQGAAIADAANGSEVISKFNLLLAYLRSRGDIAT